MGEGGRLKKTKRQSDEETERQSDIGMNNPDYTEPPIPE